MTVGARVEIRAITRSDLPAVARIHREAFPRSRLTRLGQDVVVRYYGWLLEGPHLCVAELVEVDGTMAGYSFGGVFRGASSGFVRRHWGLLARSLVRQPGLLLSWTLSARSARLMRLALRLGRADRPAGGPEVPWGLQSIAVASAFRGRGLGAQLLEAAEAHARADGHRLMQLTVEPENVAAIRAYERAGWVKRRAPGQWTGAMEKRLE